MTATGYTDGQAQAMLGQARAIKAEIDQHGQDVVQNFAALTTEGMQGGAADAANQTAQEIQRISQQAEQVISALEQQVHGFGDNMRATDARGQANILG